MEEKPDELTSKVLPENEKALSINSEIKKKEETKKEEKRFEPDIPDFMKQRQYRHENREYSRGPIPRERNAHVSGQPHPRREATSKKPMRRDNTQNERPQKEKYVRKTGTKPSIYDMERRMNSRRKKILKRLMALAMAGSLAVGGFVGYKMGKGNPVELLPYDGSQQTLALLDSTLASSIQRYSTIVSLENSGVELTKEQEAELFRLINYDIIPNSNTVVGNYIDLVKSKISSSLNLQDSSNIEILFDVSGQIQVQQKNGEDIQAIYPLDSFKDTPIQEALMNLREYNAKFLSNNTLKDIVNRENIMVLGNNSRDYVNSVIEMANHSQELEEAQLSFNGEKFYVVEPEKAYEDQER